VRSGATFRATATHLRIACESGSETRDDTVAEV
jgi:hypothetical protein